MAKAKLVPSFKGIPLPARFTALAASIAALSLSTAAHAQTSTPDAASLNASTTDAVATSTVQNNSTAVASTPDAAASRADVVIEPITIQQAMVAPPTVQNVDFIKGIGTIKPYKPVKEFSNFAIGDAQYSLTEDLDSENGKPNGTFHFQLIANTANIANAKTPVITAGNFSERTGDTTVVVAHPLGENELSEKVPFAQYTYATRIKYGRTDEGKPLVSTTQNSTVAVLTTDTISTVEQDKHIDQIDVAGAKAKAEALTMIALTAHPKIETPKAPSRPILHGLLNAAHFVVNTARNTIMATVRVPVTIAKMPYRAATFHSQAPMVVAPDTMSNVRVQHAWFSLPKQTPVLAQYFPKFDERAYAAIDVVTVDTKSEAITLASNTLVDAPLMPRGTILAAQTMGKTGKVVSRLTRVRNATYNLALASATGNKARKASYVLPSDTAEKNVSATGTPTLTLVSDNQPSIATTDVQKDWKLARTTFRHRSEEGAVHDMRNQLAELRNAVRTAYASRTSLTDDDKLVVARAARYALLKFENRQLFSLEESRQFAAEKTDMLKAMGSMLASASRTAQQSPLGKQLARSVLRHGQNVQEAAGRPSGAIAQFTAKWVLKPAA